MLAFMTTPESREPANDPQTQQMLARSLDQIRGYLDPTVAETVLPPDTEVLGAHTELYRSSALRSAQDTLPGRYASIDRSLIILNLPAGKQVFLVSGRATPGDPLDFEHALGGGEDSRDIHSSAYTYDGDGIITEYLLHTGEVFTHDGEYGDPATLVQHVRARLGEYAGAESAGQPIPADQILPQQ